MKRNVYQNYAASDMILRDHLALERTTLANESTLLAYIRTAVGLLAAGGSIIQFLSGAFSVLAGTVCVVIGFLVLIVGVNRYFQMKNTLEQIVEENKHHEHHDLIHQMVWTCLDKLHLAKIKS